MSCSTCAHHDAERAWCRARPPKVMEAEHDGVRQLVTVWPMVQPEDWCGAYLTNCTKL